MMFDVIIKNGLVADGVSDTLVQADVAITGAKISVLQPGLNPDNCKTLVDATGKIVSPGFVDVHSHSDYYLLIDPRAESKLLQGVTTEIGGNCGYSAAPMCGDLRARRADDYKAQFGLDVGWSGMDEYFSALEAVKPGVNFGALIGYNTVRGSVLGENSSQPDSAGIKALKAMVERGLDHGAVGMSVGIVYPPACFAGIDELTEVFRTVAEKGKTFTSHIRSEGANLLDALTEVTTIARNSGCRLQVSHLKTAGKANWQKLDRAFEILESAQADGVDINADRYPYLASNTGLVVVLPAEAFDAGRENLVNALGDPGARESFKQEILKVHPEPEYWDSVMIAQVTTDINKDLEGLTVSQAAQVRGKEIFSFVFDLLREEKTDVEAIFFCMNNDNLERILTKPWVVVGSDSGARAIDGPMAIGRPHPRTFGTFPKFFKEFVREKKLFTIPQAVRKSSSQAMEFFGIRDRGKIAPGYYADIAVFDIGEIGDCSTYASPLAYSVGIEHVFVNGVHSVINGAVSGAPGGQVITC